MPILLDDKPTQLPGQTLGDVLDAAAEQLGANGRIVVEVQVNGLALLGDELEAARAETVDGKDVSLISAEPAEIAVDALQFASQRLEDARGSQAEAAELLQQDQSVAAFAKIGEAAGAWQQTQEAVLQSSQLIQMDLDKKMLDGEPVSKSINDLLLKLRELHELIVAQDTVSLADALAYEWPETVDTWQNLITQMIQWVSESKTD